MEYLILLSRFFTSPVTTLRSLIFKYKVRKILETINATKKNMKFVYIGANDGKTGSLMYPLIKKYGWKGLFVEPQENAFKKLLGNYSGIKDMKFVKGVVAEKNGWRTFYQSRHSYLSSLYPDDWFKRRNKGIAYLKRKLIGGGTKIKVKSYTLSKLLKKYNISNFDILFIDTEGTDLEIINQINFDILKPKAIFFEIIYFTCEAEMLAKFLNKLINLGYTVIKGNYDAFAYIEKE